MPRVQIDLPIRYYTDFGRSELLSTTYDMDFLPAVGERISPLKNDPESGMTFEIYRRHWDEKGQVTLQLHNYIINPEHEVPLGHTSWWAHNRAWAGHDGEDLVALLLANGWWRYGEEPESSVDDRIIGMQFVQNNYGDALSASEIYRQTKKLIGDKVKTGDGPIEEEKKPSSLVEEVLSVAIEAVVSRLLFETASANDVTDTLKEGDDDGGEKSSDPDGPQ